MILTGKRKSDLLSMRWEQIESDWFWDAPPSHDRTFGHSFEYHFEIERRAADDLENFGGRGLLLPRLGKFAGESCDLGIFD